MVKDLEGGSDPPSLTSEGEASFFNPELKMEKAFRIGKSSLLLAWPARLTIASRWHCGLT